VVLRGRRVVAVSGSAALMLVGCAQILGIADVPPPSGADASDGGISSNADGGLASDAPFDSLVIPDGPFDGCNRGAEDCANGIDDNCNGLVDCADPVCQGAAYQCVPDAPAGWTLVSFAASAGEVIPVGCSGAYADTIAQGHGGMSAPPATCGCACTSSQAMGTTCPPVVFSGYAGNSCNSAVEQSINVNGVGCGDFASAQGSIRADPGSPTSLGSCGPIPSKTLPTIHWSSTYTACGYSAPADQGGCNAGNQCVHLPYSAFDPQPCVAHAGEVPCPGAPFGKKSVVDTGVTDMRDCTSCVCTPSGGACAATITGYPSNGCSGATIVAVANGTCTAMADNAASVHVDSATTTPASCSPSSSTPTGDATVSGAVTVCCP
jgi:hypothetical protein